MKKSNILNILRSKSSVFTFKEILLATIEAKPPLLKRRLNYYIKKGELYHIRRGLYAKDKNYNKLELATKIFALLPIYNNQRMAKRVHAYFKDLQAEPACRCINF
jgi:hypothetical protein